MFTPTWIRLQRSNPCKHPSVGLDGQINRHPYQFRIDLGIDTGFWIGQFWMQISVQGPYRKNSTCPKQKIHTKHFGIDSLKFSFFRSGVWKISPAVGGPCKVEVKKHTQSGWSWALVGVAGNGVNTSSKAVKMC